VGAEAHARIEANKIAAGIRMHQPLLKTPHVLILPVIRQMPQPEIWRYVLSRTP
jgi:hypothetical protein